jgi:predicted small lipoprotein YifL
MSRLLLLLCAATVLSACGIKRPLMRPADIPAYEEQQRRKFRQLQEDMERPENVPAPAPKPAPSASQLGIDTNPPPARIKQH